MAPNLARSTHDLTLNIISSKLEGDGGPTDKDAAKIAHCSDRTIRRHRLNYLAFGSTKAPPNRGGRPSAITSVILSAIRDLLARKSTLPLNKLVTFVRKEFGVETTRFSIRRALEKDAGWSKKVTQNVAKERNADLRDAFRHEMSQLPSYLLVDIDESAVDRTVGNQKKGWAPRGKRPQQVKRFHRGRRFQIILAYTQDGVLHYMVNEENTDTEMFEAFIETLLPFCGRYPEPRSVLVMDNASIHFSDKIQRMLDEAGVKVRPRPPYSPDLAAIEGFFGELKNHIRKVWDNLDDFVRADFGAFLEDCIEAVGSRKESARGHFRHAGFSIDELEE